MAVIDYGREFDLLWVVAMDEGSDIWCVPNPQVRVQANWSLGRSREMIPPRGKLAAVAVSP